MAEPTPHTDLGPLDSEVHRRLTSGHRGSPKFKYYGRFPGDPGTDVYHVTHPDPNSPDTFNYGFTVRYRPEAEQPFSYNATRHQSGVTDDGERDPGSFVDVTGNMDHIAMFGTVPQLLQRHNDLLKVLKISPKGSGTMKTSSDGFDEIIRANDYSGSCDMCGKAVRDIPESSFRDDKLYEVEPEDEAPGMHGKPVRLCGTCSVDSDVIHNIRKNPKSFGWHHDGAEVGKCQDCDRSIMEEADEDLRP